MIIPGVSMINYSSREKRFSLSQGPGKTYCRVTPILQRQKEIQRREIGGTEGKRMLLTETLHEQLASWGEFS